MWKLRTVGEMHERGFSMGPILCGQDRGGGERVPHFHLPAVDQRPARHERVICGHCPWHGRIVGVGGGDWPLFFWHQLVGHQLVLSTPRCFLK